MKATYYVAIETKVSLSRAIVTKEVLDMIVHQLRNQHRGVDFSDFTEHIYNKRRRFTSQSDENRFSYENWLDSDDDDTDIKKINVFSHNEALQNNILLMTLGDYFMMHNFAENNPYNGVSSYFYNGVTIVPSHFEIDDFHVHLVFRIDLPNELPEDEDIQSYIDQIQNLLEDSAGLDANVEKLILVVNDLNPRTPELQTLIDEKLVLTEDFKPSDDDIIIENNKFSLKPEAEDLLLTATGRVKLQLAFLF